MGGAGSAVNEFVLAQNLGNQVLNLGIPDAFIEHATHNEMLSSCGLDAQGIEQAILARLATNALKTINFCFMGAKFALLF
jgi:1-deoxy-D-xylulose-5-phosphate synthase